MLGANVIGYSLDPTYEKSIFDLTGISKNIKNYIGDIRDLNNLIEVSNILYLNIGNNVLRIDVSQE